MSEFRDAEPHDDDSPRRDPPRRDDRDFDRDRGDRRRPEPRGNGIATASLVLGILSLCGGLTSLPGIICGIVGLSRSKQRGTGQGKAVAGLVLSSFGLVLVLPAVLIALLLPAVQKVREAAVRMQSQNNMKQIGLATMNYDSAMGRLPPQAICDKNGRKLLSWRVAILPYLEQDYLYNQFKLDEPWDSPSNKRLVAQMPKTYADPRRLGDQALGLTLYKVFAGKKTPFALTDDTERNQPPFVNPWSISSLTASSRGTSSLIFCVEGGDPVVWTKPDDFDYDPALPLPDFKPQYSGGLMVLMGDGSVRVVRKGFRESAMRASIEPNNPSRESLD